VLRLLSSATLIDRGQRCTALCKTAFPRRPAADPGTP